MQRPGYKGAFEMAATVDYLYGYDATARIGEDWMYEQVTERYVADPEVRKFFAASNPWALQGIAERLLEAAARGLWNAPDDAVGTPRDALLEAEGWAEGGPTGARRPRCRPPSARPTSRWPRSPTPPT